MDCDGLITLQPGTILTSVDDYSRMPIRIDSCANFDGFPPDMIVKSSLIVEECPRFCNIVGLKASEVEFIKCEMFERVTKQGSC